MRTNINDIIGRQEGNLIILEKLPSKNGRTVVRCRCTVCNGEDYQVYLTNIRQKKYKSCGCIQYRNNMNNPRWKGYGEISASFLLHAQHSAKKRNIPFNISIEYLWRLFLKQKKQCALSGATLSFPTCLRDYSQTASIDRIDASKGYIEGNIQWVHKNINYAKQEMDNHQFLDMVKKIYEYKFQ